MNRRRLKRVIPTDALIVLVAFSFWIFIRHNSRRITLQNEEYIEELTLQRAVSIDSLIEENESSIASIAYLYGEGLESHDADIEAIGDFERNCPFDRLRFIDAVGDDYTSEGMLANLADRDYFQAGMRGQSGITFVKQSRVTGERQIGFYAPVRYDDEVIGVMVGFYGERFLQRLLAFELFGYEGESWICASDGTVLGSTYADPPENYLTHLQESGRCTTREAERLGTAFAEGIGTSFTWREGNDESIGYAVPLEKQGWMLVRSFPPSASSQILRNANNEGQSLILALATLFGAYILSLSIDFLSERRNVREAARDANDVSFGVARLFHAFVLVDLAASKYRYVNGTKPADSAIPDSGDYQQLYSGVLDNVVGDEEHREEVSRLISADGLREALSTQDTTSLRVHAPAGSIEWFTFNFIVLERDEAGVPSRLLMVCQDVTELHHKEEAEQQQLQEALGRAEHASNAKTEFLFNMSHDIRTPMNAILGYTELAQREGTSREEILEYVRKIDASSQHLLALINDILEMSRIESGKMRLEPEVCDLAQVVDEARSLFTTQMRAKGIHFMVDSCSSVTDRWVLCDRNRLNRIILNLISNAYKFTDEGGSVSVELIQNGSGEGEASFALHVRDTGIGMSPEFAEKLFTPFERERTSTVSGIQGTGLGLSITKSIVDLMGGAIEVRTKQGEGTEFIVHVSFPIAEPPAQDEPRDTTAPVEVDFAGKRLLLAEDNDINREIATLILSSYGFELETAVNGQEAVEMVASSEPGHYDAVLMDIQMPVMDGYAAARAIGELEDERLARIPIIAMTANAFAEDVQAARDVGMCGHIAKPLEVDKMLATLTEVLGR